MQATFSVNESGDCLEYPENDLARMMVKTVGAESLNENVVHLYKGCVCDWPVYLASTGTVGPDLIAGTK